MQGCHLHFLHDIFTRFYVPAIQDRNSRWVYFWIQLWIACIKIQFNSIQFKNVLLPTLIAGNSASRLIVPANSCITIRPLNFMIEYISRTAIPKLTFTRCLQSFHDTIALSVTNCHTTFIWCQPFWSNVTPPCHLMIKRGRPCDCRGSGLASWVAKLSRSEILFSSAAICLLCSTRLSSLFLDQAALLREAMPTDFASLLTLTCNMTLAT